MKKYLLFLFILIFSSMGALSQTTYPCWKYHTQLPDALFGHRMVMLPDGNVLITGGFNSSDRTSRTSLIYNFSNGKILASGALNQDRAFHSLIIVPNGTGKARIYLVGGYSGSITNCTSTPAVEYLDYDPSQSILNWRTISSLKTSRADAAVAIHKGFIVINGGINQNSGNFRSGIRLSSTERINIANNSVDNIGTTGKLRAGHLLSDIRNDLNQQVLITCTGESGGNSTTELLENWVWNAYSFSPRSYRDFGVSFSDIAGVARIIGGFSSGSAAQNTAEWYDIKSGWKYSPSMTQPRANFDYTLIAGVKDTVPSYLVVGGDGASAKTSSSEYFTLPDNANPGGIWLSLPSMNDACSFRTISMTGLNLPLAIGGLSVSALNRTEIFQPLRVNDINFSPEEVGRISDSVRVIVRNEWLLPVLVNKFELNNNAEFILTGDTSDFVIPPNSSRTVFLRFRPGQIGSRTGELYLTLGSLTDTVKISGSGIASSIRILTNSVDFGEVIVGQDSLICFPAIRNQGTDTTYIDSISVVGMKDYIVVSPKGRVKIAPGDSLEVCIRFLPGDRNKRAASLLVHISLSAYPCNLTGKGIMKYITGRAYNGCDTVNLIAGNIYQSYLTIENPGDRDVSINSYSLSGGSQNLFTINQPFPSVVPSGFTKSIPVEFRPQTEGTFTVNITFVHDGIPDSLKYLTVCFVVRSKNGSVSQSIIDFGNLCIGDSIKTDVTVENPSFFENMTLDSVASSDNSGLLSIAAPTLLQLKARESSKFTVKFRGTSEVDFNSDIIVYTSGGSIRIPVKCKVVPAISFTAPDITGASGDFATVTFSADTYSKDFSGKLNVSVSYDPSMLFPDRIAQVTGGFQLDLNNSKFLNKNYGSVELELSWLEPVNNTKAAFSIVFEVLKGSHLSTELLIASNINPDYCLKESSSKFMLTELCGGRAGLIKNSQLVLYSIYPNPSNSSTVINLFHENEVHFSLINNLGQVLEQRIVSKSGNNFSSLIINLEQFSSGIYLLHVADGSNIIVKPIIINK